MFHNHRLIYLHKWYHCYHCSMRARMVCLNPHTLAVRTCNLSLQPALHNYILTVVTLPFSQVTTVKPILSFFLSPSPSRILIPQPVRSISSLTRPSPLNSISALGFFVVTLLCWFVTIGGWILTLFIHFGYYCRTIRFQDSSLWCALSVMFPGSAGVSGLSMSDALSQVTQLGLIKSRFAFQQHRSRGSPS